MSEDLSVRSSAPNAPGEQQGMTAGLLFIGLDAMEATLIDRWAAEGHLPAFTELTRRSATTTLPAGPMDSLPGGIWPEIWSGRPMAELPLYFMPQQLRTGDSRPHRVSEDEVDASSQVWARASDAGARTAVVDMPQAVRIEGMNGVHLVEWGLHDRQFTTSSEPPELLDQIDERWGPHPLLSCDLHGETHEGYAELRSTLLRAAEMKRELLTDLLGREQWDLFACAFSEAHCAGHQLMRFVDPHTLGAERDAPALLRDAMLDVYRAIDRALAALLDAAGPDATVLVLCSHGMGSYIGGYQLMPPLLRAMGLAPGGPVVGATARLRRWLDLTQRRAQRLRAAARREPLPNRHPLEIASTKAVALPNNRCGAIRLNLVGREPNGCVRPGAEADALLHHLAETISDLGHVDTGESIVARVDLARDLHGPDHHPDLPDLTVAFRRDLGPLEVCVSPRYGRIEQPIYKSNLPRSGDHTDTSRLWLSGPGIEADAQVRPGSTLDVAPTLLSLLGLDHADLSGEPLVLSARAERP